MLIIDAVTTIYDGSLTDARFSQPWGLGIDNHNNVYVADHNNHTIRYISNFHQNVSTLAGNVTIGYKNSFGKKSLFFSPSDVVSTKFGNVLYIADSNNRVIRQISCTVGYSLSYGQCLLFVSVPIYSLHYMSNIIANTFVGNTGYGSVDGTATQVEFQYPQGLCINPNETILAVVDPSSLTIHQIDIQTAVTTRKGKSYSFYNPNYCVIDEFNSIYVTEPYQIVKISVPNNNTVKVIAGSIVLKCNPGMFFVHA